MNNNLIWSKKLSPLVRAQYNSPETIGDKSRLIVELNRRKTDRIYSIIDSNQGKINRELRIIPSLAIELPNCCLEQLARSQFVKKIWYDARVKVCLDVAVPAIGGAAVHQMGFSGDGVVVAVIDTGIAPHPDLIIPENRILAWHNLVNDHSHPYDDNGHGTHVAGIIAGNGHSSGGRFCGVAPKARLIGIKALDSEGSGTLSTVISGIEWCLKNRTVFNIRIINLSIGALAQESYRSDPLCRATSAAWKEGIVVCAAAGNEGPDTGTINTPGINPPIITVGNSNDQQTLIGDDDWLNQTSSRGPTIDNISKPDLLAPGTKITSLWVKKNYKTLTGTSMATPMVSGASALILEKWPSLKPDEVKRLLIKNARSLGLGSSLQGAGVLDIEKIFKAPVNSGLAIREISSNIYEVLGYQLLKYTLQKSNRNTPSLEEKLDQLSEESLLKFINTLHQKSS
ncbi:MAG TPA: S8 family peptidase [Bacillota bacterium]|nr:S8 family peptidase [Bacillota bacterium]